jgi:hypothetical protein
MWGRLRQLTDGPLGNHKGCPYEPRGEKNQRLGNRHFSSMFELLRLTPRLCSVSSVLQKT